MQNNLLAKYAQVRHASVEMVAPLEIEDYIPQPVEFVSPPKWNLAHTSWFFEELILKSYLKTYKEFNTHFGFLFNSYYNSLGDRVERGNRGDLSRPTVNEVFEYRKYVDRYMEELLSGKLTHEILELIELGLNHEQQHQELFYTDLKYTFHLNPLYPPYNNVALAEQQEEGTQGFVEIKGGIYEIGFAGNGFSYDNEHCRHKVYLDDFELATQLVSNGEYLEFIDDGGYTKFDLWHDEALAWLSKNKVTNPLYWHKIDGKWYQYTLAGMRQIKPKDILTHINYYEAAAYAQWKGMRLPTEFEWETAADKIEWGKRWEWTESAYLPYPGFEKQTGAVGEYNGKFMVNQKVLRGGSVATPPGHSRKTYRNFFHPHIAYQFNGIRLAK